MRATVGGGGVCRVLLLIMMKMVLVVVLCVLPVPTMSEWRPACAYLPCGRHCALGPSPAAVLLLVCRNVSWTHLGARSNMRVLSCSPTR